jgi:hypothetical protein
MERKKSGKMFSGILFHFEKRESQKDKKGEKRSEVNFTATSTIIISISFLTLLITLLTSC